MITDPVVGCGSANLGNVPIEIAAANSWEIETNFLKVQCRAGGYSGSE